MLTIRLTGVSRYCYYVMLEDIATGQWWDFEGMKWEIVDFNDNHGHGKLHDRHRGVFRSVMGLNEYYGFDAEIPTGAFSNRLINIVIFTSGGFEKGDMRFDGIKAIEAHAILGIYGCVNVENGKALIHVQEDTPRFDSCDAGGGRPLLTQS